MIITNDGTRYATVKDAAKEFGVSPKTVSEWIKKKIIPEPPEFYYGAREPIWHFPPAYMKKAKAALDKYRRAKSKRRR